MGTVEKIALGVIGVALATTLILPDRKTVQVLAEGRRLLVESLRTAMGR